MHTRSPNKILEKQYEQQGSKCFWCREPVPFSFITREHFYPKQDGHTLVNNKIFACGFCNKFKGHKSVNELHDAALHSIRKILTIVIEQEWKITPKQLKKFRKLVKILNTTGKMIKSNYQPEVLFT